MIWPKGWPRGEDKQQDWRWDSIEISINTVGFRTAGELRLQTFPG